LSKNNSGGLTLPKFSFAGRSDVGRILESLASRVKVFFNPEKVFFNPLTRSGLFPSPRVCSHLFNPASTSAAGDGPYSPLFAILSTLFFGFRENPCGFRSGPPLSGSECAFLLHYIGVPARICRFGRSCPIIGLESAHTSENWARLNPGSWLCGLFRARRY